MRMIYSLDAQVGQMQDKCWMDNLQAVNGFDICKEVFFVCFALFFKASAVTENVYGPRSLKYL